MKLLRQAKRALVRRLRPPTMVQARSTRPSSDSYGYDRGQPIDRYYIERFFRSYAGDIRGAVLEIQEPAYSGRFGSGVTSTDIVDIDADNERATIVADLTAADAIPSNRFDCFVLPQTLQYIYDLRAAVRHAHRILRPGGVLLATVPASARIDPGLFTSDYWRFTPASCERLFGEAFGPEGVLVASFGNALSGAAFTNGLSVEEFSASELDPVDSHFPLILTVRAIKRAGS